MASTPYQTIFSPVQWARLQIQFQQAVKSPFYRRHVGLKQTQKLKSVAEFFRLPITTKADLVNNNLDFLAVDAACICEWVTTSGTTGKPVRIALSKRDIQRLAENEAAALRLAGMRAGDGLIIAVGMDRLFVAGLAYWLGAQKLGAVCLRSGPALVDLSSISITPLGPSGRWFIIGVPSLLGAGFRLADGLPPHIGGVIGIGESLCDADLNPNTICRILQDSTHAPVLSTYASTETCSTFAQGPQCRANHLNPRMAIIEILNDRSHPVAPGTPGRVVITPLGQHAMPLLRFDTGDIATLYTDRCPCGRRTPRLGPILGRAAQLLKIQGVSVFATAIIDLVRKVYPGMDTAILADRDSLGGDRITIYVVCPAHRRDMLKKRFDRAAQSQLKWLPPVQYCQAQAITEIRALRPSRKATIFIDARY